MPLQRFSHSWSSEVPPIDDLERIEAALDAAELVLGDFTPGTVEVAAKAGGDPLTDADLAVDDALRRSLPTVGEGWLSEETTDDLSRLDTERVWIVDPIDGTREFVAGIPDWCVSIGLVINGLPVAGGIVNPASGERITGAVGRGVNYRGNRPVVAAKNLDGALVAASRSELKRGEWDRFRDEPFEVVPMGSVAYKLALVAAGRFDATWTLCPKNEWDLAGGAALLAAAGKWGVLKDGSQRRWNNADPLVPGFIATSDLLRTQVTALLLG
jgi:myo-inositol-1(or 4)-monophosphatase